MNGHDQETKFTSTESEMKITSSLIRSARTKRRKQTSWGKTKPWKTKQKLQSLRRMQTISYYFMTEGKVTTVMSHKSEKHKVAVQPNNMHGNSWMKLSNNWKQRVRPRGLYLLCQHGHVTSKIITSTKYSQSPFTIGLEQWVNLKKTQQINKQNAIIVHALFS